MSVKLDHISKSYGDVSALEKISFQTGSGELFGLIGPDGAGKTTLFRILVTLILADEGTCTINGLDVKRDFREIRRIIGYMPGRFSLYQDLSVKENLEFYATVFGTTVRENYELIREIYRHIEPFENRLAGRLSGGMKQKLALSCALIHRPEVLVLDEPTTGVDAVSRTEFWEILKEIRNHGITILVATPYMDEAALCDRVGLLQDGRLLALTEPGKLGLPGQMAIFSFRCSDEIYPHLERIRLQPQCHSAFLFGDEIHIMTKNSHAKEILKKIISAWGVPGLDLRDIPPGIEDVFMELMKPEEVEHDR